MKMTPQEMIAEWRKGCSCAPSNKPTACYSCTLALINALAERVERAEKQNDRLMQMLEDTSRLSIGLAKYKGICE